MMHPRGVLDRLVLRARLMHGASTGGAAAQESTSPPSRCLSDALPDAVWSRRYEYDEVRRCAASAGQRLGLDVGSLPRRPDRSPLWGPGTVGSLTHCRGYRAAVVASSSCWRAWGLDAEPLAALTESVASRIVRSDENMEAVSAALNGPGEAACLLFSIKEALFKAQSFLGGRMSGPLACMVEAAVDLTFTAQIGTREFAGAWDRRRSRGGVVILTAVGVPVLPGPGAGQSAAKP